MKKWMIAGLVLLVLAVSAPYAVGVLTEQQWQNATRQLNSETPFVQVNTREYDRQYFGGHMAGDIRFSAPESNETHRVTYEGVVSHGITGSEIEFTPSSDDVETMKELFPDEQPRLTITTNLWGTMEVDLNIPAIEYQDEQAGGTISIAAVTAWAEISEQGDAFELTLDWPGMELDADDMKMAVSGVTMTQDAERVLGQIWEGEVNFGIEGLQANSPGQPAFQMESLEVDSDTEAEDERLKSTIALTMASMTVAEKSYGPHRIEVDLKNLSIPAWSDLMDVVTEARVATATMSSGSMSADQRMQQQMNIMQRMGEAARNVAAAGLSIGMPVIELETPEGEVTGNWVVSHPEVPEDKRDGMQLVMQQVTGELSLSVPVALVESNPALAQNAQGLVNQGLVTREDDIYRIKASLADMMMNVNGQEMPLPPLI